MKEHRWNIAGVDYGSKLAGTTVIAHLLNGSIRLYQSQKKKDADAFLRNWVKEQAPSHLFLDAPLSLPGVYTMPSLYDDYFYRKADRELRAMSPMFLGGLTARAMRLKKEWSDTDIRLVEIYPAKLADLLLIRALGYKKQKAQLERVLEKMAPALHGFEWSPSEIDNWHQVDALLALMSGLRFLKDEHLAFGEEKEGIIVV